MAMDHEPHWTELFQAFLATQGEGDPAHDLQHIQRVVLNTRQLAAQEKLGLDILLPAAWLHDCVHVAKDSPQRSQASVIAADHAITFLRQNDYPAEHLEAIHHAISAHSFSAQITPRTLEAKVLQDADRIDALGAVGLSRCLMLGGYMGSSLMSENDPFCETRTPDDARYCVDHFFAKLLTLQDTMQTAAGRDLAKERTDFLHHFLDQLKQETCLDSAPTQPSLRPDMAASLQSIYEVFEHQKTDLLLHLFAEEEAFTKPSSSCAVARPSKPSPPP